MISGYCGHCQQQVSAKREEIDICLAIILAIFTVGIGLAIYLAIWHSKPINRCVHCLKYLPHNYLWLIYLPHKAMPFGMRVVHLLFLYIA